MPAVERTLLIRAAPEAVFDLIARVENFPQYSPAIREVHALGRDTYRWVVNVAGFELDWDSVVTEKARPAPRTGARQLTQCNDQSCFPDAKIRI